MAAQRMLTSISRSETQVSMNHEASRHHLHRH